MTTKIYCRTTQKGVQSFYLSHEGRDYFLFNQDFRRGVREYFIQGVALTKGMDFGRSRHDKALMKTMEKIPMYVRYIEKEYGINVLEQTKKKNKQKGSYAYAA